MCASVVVLLFCAHFSNIYADISIRLYRAGQEGRSGSQWEENLTNYLISLDNLLNQKRVPSAKMDHNVNYHGLVYVGSEKVRFNLLVDTLSSAIWLPSRRCYFPTCFSHTNYDAQQSHWYEPDDRNITLYFGYSYLNGHYSTDTITVDSASVEGVSFIEATWLQNSVLPFRSVWDGVLGLGLLSPHLQAAPLLSTILDRGLIDQPIFSFHLLGDDKSAGEVLLGGQNKSLYREETLVFTPLIADDMWKFKIELISADDLVECLSGCEAVVDTAAYFIAVPQVSLDNIFTKLTLNINGEKQIQYIGCSEVSSLPALTFVIEKQEFSLNGKDYTFKIEDKCVVGLASSPAPVWVLGSLFLQRVYTIFSLAERKIGFAHFKP